MGSYVLFYAGPQDLKDLNAFIRSLGLTLVPPGPEILYSEDETVLGTCYISLVPQDTLRSWGPITRWYSDAADPIISFIRSVREDQYISPGDIYWNSDVAVLARQTKPYFQTISRWIRSNWPKPEGRDYHYGPEASQLIFEEGLIATSLVPGVQLHTVQVTL